MRKKEKSKTRTCVAADGARKVGVDVGGETVVLELVRGKLARADVLRLGHASCRENTDEAIEVGFRRCL